VGKSGDLEAFAAVKNLYNQIETTPGAFPHCVTYLKIVMEKETVGL
jgi:hypothetical protein